MKDFEIHVHDDDDVSTLEHLEEGIGVVSLASV